MADGARCAWRQRSERSGGMRHADDAQDSRDAAIRR
jgi:hypothetical protein